MGRGWFRDFGAASSRDNREERGHTNTFHILSFVSSIPTTLRKDSDLIIPVATRWL
jgi:hypothetical protein